MSMITEAELQELERRAVFQPGLLDPVTLTRLIASLRYLQDRLQRAEAEIQTTSRSVITLRDEIELRDEADYWKRSYHAALAELQELREEQIQYRARLSRIIGEIRTRQQKRQEAL